jgi:MinD superfamily P-loop ATPase
MVPEVDEGRCTSCGKCKEICHFNAITVFPGTVLTFPEMCHGCYGCVEVCPEKCISPGQKLVGKIFAGERDGLFLAYGLLEIGEPMASPLIKALKERFLRPEELNIVDCPPGTACAVLTAVRGADYCLLVTEPTPFGLHDLQQAVGAVRALGVPCGVIVNRAGEDFPELYRYLEKERIPLLLEIENDRRVAEAYARGKTLLEVRPELREKFQKLLREIAL